MVHCEYGTLVQAPLPPAARGARSRTVGRLLMAAALVCTLCLIVAASSKQAESTLVQQEADGDLSPLSFSREARQLQSKARIHQRNAAALLKQYDALEASLPKHDRLSLSTSGHSLLADAPAAAGSAAPAPAAAAGSAAPAPAAAAGSAAPAAAASGSAAAAASGSAAVAASGAASATTTTSSASASTSSSGAALPKYSDDVVRPVEEGDDAVPQGEVDLADPHPPQQEVDAQGGAFNKQQAFSTAGDEFLTVKDLVNKVQERETENANELITAQSKFADDTFVVANSDKLNEPLVGFLGRDASNGLAINPDGPAQPARISGNGLRDLFVPVGSDIAPGAAGASTGASAASAASAAAASGAAAPAPAAASGAAAPAPAAAASGAAAPAPAAAASGAAAPAPAAAGSAAAAS